MNSGPLADKSIVIMGGTSGLGLSATHACVAAGASVLVVGRDREKCSRAVSLHPDRIRSLVADASDSDTAERAFELAKSDFGTVDGLYHVAGGSGRAHGDGPLHAISDEGWQYTLRTNLDSLFFSNRAATRFYLAESKPGVILNMASVLAFAPSATYFATHAYAATKAAAIGLTKSAAAYYAPHNIRINAIAPSLVDTPMAQRARSNDDIMRFVNTKQPLDGGRIGRPSDLDAAVIYFLSDQSRFVTGQVLAIDGGWCLTDGQRQG